MGTGPSDLHPRGMDRCEEQRKVAEETIRDVDASGHWPAKAVTEISKACLPLAASRSPTWR